MSDERGRMYERYRSLLANGTGNRESWHDRLVRAYLPRDKSVTVFELGCGDGRLLRTLAAHGYRDACGVDLSHDQVARAHAARTARVEQCDVFDALLRVPAGNVDVVIAIDLLEHLSKAEVIAVLDEVYRVLRVGGRLVVHTVNAESPFFGAVRYGDFTHCNAFTKLSVEQVCRAAGFTRTECYEDSPAVHGLKSGARWVLWQATRTVMRAALAAETGTLNSILSRNLFAIAVK